MTEPTDNELDAVLCNQWPAFSMQATLVRVWARAAMRDALAKWGTPPAVAGEPVAWLSTDCIGERYLCFTKPNDSDPVRPLVFGDTTPQPTQAQAGAVPLTDEQLWANDEIMSLNADLGWHMDTIRMFTRVIERAHGIKGGQHGAE